MWSSLMRELLACNEMDLRLEKINYNGSTHFQIISAAAGSRCASYAASKHALQVRFLINNSVQFNFKLSHVYIHVILQKCQKKSAVKNIYKLHIDDKLYSIIT